MKNVYKIGIIIALTCAIAIYYTFPKIINLTFNGIRYKVDNQQQQEQVTININGSYRKRILKKDLFEGSIKIDNQSFDGLEISVGANSSWISSFDKDSQSVKYYGEIFTDNTLRKFTISAVGKDGFMISAPAKDRVDAVKISNELMKNVLKENFKFK